MCFHATEHVLIWLCHMLHVTCVVHVCKFIYALVHICKIWTDNMVTDEEFMSGIKLKNRRKTLKNCFKN